MESNSTAVCRKCRREGKKLFLKGERCYGPQCPFTRRSYAPGQHGTSRAKRLSEYGVQLREKQKAKAVYGIMEKQFSKYYDQMKRSKGKFSILSLVERRLDNVVYRLGFAKSRPAARQLVNHGHIAVNGKRLDIPSHQIKLGDKISFKKQENNFSKEVAENLKNIMPVSWLKYDLSSMTAEVTSMPKPEDIGSDIEERLIIEHYSR